MQIELTQDAISKPLDLKSPNKSTIRNLYIEGQETVSLEDHKEIRHIFGYFCWQLPGTTQSFKSPFELFLESGEKQQSWRLAKPVGSFDQISQGWETYPLEITN